MVVEYVSNRIGHAEYHLHVRRNEIEQVGHWIGVRLDESSMPSPNVLSPVGAIVTVSTPTRVFTRQIVNGDSFSTQHAPVAHFGLGDSTVVDAITVRWPDGTEAHVAEPQIDRYYRGREMVFDE